MGSSRIEAVSDGVLAIAITVMVLEMQAPVGTDLASLVDVAPTFLSYVLSFIYIAIHWNNHHHLFKACPDVTWPVMWANMHLLFWLSLIPFVTDWMGRNHFAALPTAAYGAVLLMAAVAYQVLQNAIMHAHSEQSPLKQHLREQHKGRISLVLYLAGIVLSLSWPVIGGFLYAAVAALWVVPDNKLANLLREETA